MRDGNIRVSTEAHHRELYNNMKTCGAIEDFHEFFFACVCVGYSRGKARPLERKDDRFWSRTVTPLEWDCYHAIIMQVNDFQVSAVMDEKRMFEKLEEYANAGIDIIIDEFLRDYLITRDARDSPQLDPNGVINLPKAFLYYLLQQSEARS
jgi:hypothetical protein